MYRNLLVMTILSFISMYILMYAMVDNFINVYPNLNQLYMAAVMTFPMVILELLVMAHMYPYKKINTLLIMISCMLFAVCFLGIRRQIAIDDKEFLKSMIPHHAGALLMCKFAEIQDPEIKELCKKITLSQQEEIDFMHKKLKQTPQHYSAKV